MQTFGAYTCDLHAIAAHLTLHQVTTVVLESTGVYWIPLFALLEDYGFEVYLIEPSQARHGGARPKTDVRDCQWLQRLHTFGLLRPSFRPPESVLALRGYGRQRQMLVRSGASHVQHMQKALEQMNVKLTEVASDLTGTAILAAILRGERDPKKLAALRHDRCQKSEQEYAKALEGTWRPEHLFALKQASQLFQFYQTAITVCDQQIEDELKKLPNRASDQKYTPKSRQRGRKHNDVRFEGTKPLFLAWGVDRTLIEGIDVGTALLVLAEIGVDVSRFPTAKHFAGWLRLCPQHEQSNKTTKKRPPRKGKNRVAQALRIAGQAWSRTPSPLAAFSHRIKARLGGKGAITATAHKLAVLIYRLLRYGVEYVQQSLAEYEAQVRAQQERALRRKAAALGYELVPKGAEVQPT